jgi:hypothetical protein
MVYLVVGATTKILNIPLIFPVSMHFLLLRSIALEIFPFRTVIRRFEQSVGIFRDRNRRKDGNDVI